MSHAPFVPTLVSQITPIVTPALFFGVVFDLLLLGVLTVQTYIYHLSFPRDRILLKIIVVWVYLVGALQTSLALVYLYYSFLARAMGSRQSESGDWEVMMVGSGHLWGSTTRLTTTVAMTVQLFYAHRIESILKKPGLAFLIMCMSYGQIAIARFGGICESEELAVAARTYIAASPEEFSCDVQLRRIWGPLNIACNLTITICMLLKHNTGTTWKLLKRSRVSRLLQIVVGTGMATTVCTIVYSVLFSLWNFAPPTYAPFFPLPGLMMGKVYGNSMLVFLNSRTKICYERNAVESSESLAKDKSSRDNAEVGEEHDS